MDAIAAAGAQMIDGEFVISRTFDAPRDLVFKANTDPEHLRHWWGPKGFAVIACTVDLRPGGAFHYGLRSPNGVEMWGRWVYREIVAPERLVVAGGFSDPQGGVARHPFSPNWPLETLSTSTFVAKAGRTTLTIRWAPLNPTEEERKTFLAGRDGMEQGFGGTFAQLDAHLASIKAR